MADPQGGKSSEGGRKRFRVFRWNEPAANSQRSKDNTLEPVGAVRFAEDAQEAIRELWLLPGKFLVLCLPDMTYREFTITQRTVIEATPGKVVGL